MMPVKLLVRAALVIFLLLPAARAQQGDEKGEVQASRIPKDKIPPAPPLAPSEAVKSFKIQPGLSHDSSVMPC